MNLLVLCFGALIAFMLGLAFSVAFALSIAALVHIAKSLQERKHVDVKAVFQALALPIVGAIGSVIGMWLFHLERILGGDIELIRRVNPLFILIGAIAVLATPDRFRSKVFACIFHRKK